MPGDKITPDMEVEDVVAKFPEAVKVLTRHGIICIQCGAPIWGTLAEAIERAGKNVEEIMREVNE